MKCTNLSDLELLKKLVGNRTAVKIYQGSLSQLFACGDSESSRAKLLAARELVRRWLREELKRGSVLSSPGTVRDFLRLQFVNLEHEVFVALFLDAQNQVLGVEEM